MDTSNSSSSSAFKKQLAMVFDDNMRTKAKRWNNYLDIVIIVMIVLRFGATMKKEFGLDTMCRSMRYPLLKRNLGYVIRNDCQKTNVFVLRPSSELINFNSNKLAIAYQMSRLISDHFDGSRGPLSEDVANLKQGGFGYFE